MITYRKGSLFNPETEGQYKAHACNTYGIWGAGIAAEFKRLYPKDAKEYENYCEDCSALGTTLITTNLVVCLHTSGPNRPKAEAKLEILANTLKSLEHLGQQLNGEEATIHSNKFNSGIFGVPWEDTEAVLKVFLANYPNVSWVVWTP